MGNSIKTYLKDMVYVDWIYLALGEDHWQAVMNMAVS
jgi:hypothetical protein